MSYIHSVSCVTKVDLEDDLFGSIAWSEKQSNYFQGLNIVVWCSDENLKASEVGRLRDCPATSFVTRTARKLLDGKTDYKQSLLIKLLLPKEDGFVIRSDLLTARLAGCKLVNLVEHFVLPGQKYEVPEFQLSNQESLFEALSHSFGAVASLIPSDTADEAGRRLDEELEERLSIQWTVPTPLDKTRLVIVGHRHPDVMAGYLSSAYALGLSVALVDAAGSFLPENQRSGVVERTLAIDMTPDSLLSTRIVDILRKQNVVYHGITTFTDTWLVHVAEAAHVLGLPTVPLDTVKLCLDKHATRLLCQDKSKALRVKEFDELKSHVAAKSISFDYPLIAKPCTAWGSQGVFKANNEEELLDAVKQSKHAAKDADVIIDGYVDGPEIDANFVLQDGKVLFFEIVDGLPTTAERDLPGKGKTGDFLETDEIWPSNHPQRESDIVRSELLSILLQTGFRNGVFHLEARIKNSEMQYTIEDGILDLRPRETPLSGDPSAFLLEINQRVPGHGGSWGTALAYGIDYPALYMLCALGERDRFRTLAVPFASGARLWVDSIFINTDAAGIFEGGDAGEELKAKRPDLMEHVHYHNTYYEKGEEVTDVPARVALFMVTSQESRKELLEIAQQVRDNVEVKVRHQL
jgi:hypothetical protein